MQNYTLHIPKEIKYPIVLSSPHSGTQFPDKLKSLFRDSILECPMDADWHIHKLYDFVLDMGIPLISANYSRYVVDLNRSPQNESLYNDGRALTGVTPTKSFFGDELYKDQYVPDSKDIEKRIENYHAPYHAKLGELLESAKQKFGVALLWDAHSIKRNVPSIRKEAFPDMILGSNDEVSAPEELIQNALNSLKNSNYQIEHNYPFKGGFITRSFGKPENRVYALQLEMSQDLYMDESNNEYTKNKADQVRKTLEQVLKNLGEALL